MSCGAYVDRFAFGFRQRRFTLADVFGVNGFVVGVLVGGQFRNRTATFHCRSFCRKVERFQRGFGFVGFFSRHNRALRFQCEFFQLFAGRRQLVIDFRELRVNRFRALAFGELFDSLIVGFFEVVPRFTLRFDETFDFGQIHLDSFRLLGENGVALFDRSHQCAQFVRIPLTC